MQFGTYKSFHQEGQTVSVEFEQGTVLFQVITDEIIRMKYARTGIEYISKAIEGNKQKETSVKVTSSGNGIAIETAKLCMKITESGELELKDAKGHSLLRTYANGRTKAANISQEFLEMLEAEGHDTSNMENRDYPVQMIWHLEEGDDFYGLGDKSGFLNKKYFEYENWNSDIPQAHNEDYRALYKSVPFYIGLKKDAVYGAFFDNTFRSYLNFGKENQEYCYYGADDGDLDVYFMVGDNMPQIVGNYTYLTGTTPLPQFWTLGYMQSRWGYENKEDITEVAELYRKLQIPCDSIHLDIDYMERFKVFTWNEDAYDKEGVLLSQLAKQGYKPVCIIDPGVKVEEGYDVYEEAVANDYVAKDTDGNVYVNAVWPGDSVFPDFGNPKAREWWAGKHRYLMDMGVCGVWNDMNEPASFNGPLPMEVVLTDEGRVTNHAEMHNVYGHYMSKATHEGILEATGKRPMVITRACYAGSQKYTTVWTGDNQSLWSHLQMLVPQLCNLGLSGFAFAGTDIGGFGADCNPELLCRWIEAACFSPLFRNHSSKGSRRQEPWMFGDRVVDINRKYVELRYRFLPYLYDLFYQGEQTGLPIMRPLVLHYENDQETRNLNTEFLVGENMLVAPVLEQGVTKKMVYLPEGVWYDYWSGKRYEGKEYYLVDAPLDHCPIFIKEGSLIPTYDVVQYVGEKPYTTLRLLATPGEATYRHFQDNGEDFAYRKGEFNLYCFHKDVNGNLTVTMEQEGYTRYEKIELELIEE